MEPKYCPRCGSKLLNKLSQCVVCESEPSVCTECGLQFVVHGPGEE